MSGHIAHWVGLKSITCRHYKRHTNCLWGCRVKTLENVGNTIALPLLLINPRFGTTIDAYTFSILSSIKQILISHADPLFFMHQYHYFSMSRTHLWKTRDDLHVKKLSLNYTYRNHLTVLPTCFLRFHLPYIFHCSLKPPFLRCYLCINSYYIL